MRFRKGDMFVEVSKGGRLISDIWYVANIVDDNHIRVVCTMPFSEYAKTGTILPKSKWEGFTCLCSIESLENYKIIKRSGINFK